MSNFICYVDGGGDNVNKKNFYGSFLVYKDTRRFHQDHFNLSPKIKSNNEAEYASLIKLLDYILSIDDGDSTYTIYSDSKLVVFQLTRGWKIRAQNLKEFNDLAKNKIARLISLGLVWVPRETIVEKLGH